MIPLLIEAAASTVDAHAQELTALDQAIGDGDHGDNLRRGFTAIRGEAEALSAMEPGDALNRAGMLLVTTVGGASGPLFGSLLMGMGKAAKAGQDFTGQLAEGVALVKKRGKSDVGSKTMLDVLVPVLAALQDGADVATIRKVAADAREATKPMLALRGRASFLGERSVGHYDPGATSAMLLIDAVCDVVEGQR